MKTTNSLKALVISLALIAAVIPALGQEYMQVATNMPGFKPTMSYQNFGNGENVNGFNGGLTVSHSSSLSLPQNLGASLGLSRVYNSKSVEDYFSTSLGYEGIKHGSLGAGWTFSMGRVFLRVSSFGSATQEYRKQWFYQDESGAEHRLYLNAEITGGIEPYDPSSQNQDVSQICPRDDKWYFTNDSSFIRAKYTADTQYPYDPALGYWTIFFPDGSKKILGNYEDSTTAFVIPVIDSHRVTNTFVDGWYTTRIIDRVQNSIQIYYRAYAPSSTSDPYDGQQPYAGAIDHIVDQFNRTIDFYYKSDTNNKLNNLLEYIKYPDDSEEYFYYEVRSIPFPAQDLPFLIKVQDMAQLETLYDYKAAVSGFYLLYRIDYPTGATSIYDYESFAYQYRACYADTEPCNDVLSDTMTGVYLHKEFSAKDDGTQSDNIAVWKWDRADSADFWPGCINAQVILVPVLFTDPLGRKTVYFYAGEWGNNQMVPPGMEAGSIKYNSSGPAWAINAIPNTATLLTNAVYLSSKKFSSNGGDADKCRGDHYVGDTTPPYVVGNIRVRKTIEAEFDGSASSLEDTDHVLWKKTVNNEMWDGYGHWGLSYTDGEDDLDGKLVTACQYDLLKGEDGSPYQLDRLVASYSGMANDDANSFVQGTYVVNTLVQYPGDPGDLPNASIDGYEDGHGFKAVKMEYVGLNDSPYANSGLLKSKTQKREMVYSFSINNGVLSPVTTGSTDPKATISYSNNGTTYNGNIASVTYTGGQPYSNGTASNTYSVSFEWDHGVTKSLKWSGIPAGYMDFTRNIDTNTSRITSQWDANNLTTSFMYDSLGRLTKITPPGENPSYIHYPNATKTRTVDGIGHSWNVGKRIHFFRGVEAPASWTEPPDSPANAVPETSYSVYYFDDFGRLLKTDTLDAENRWVETMSGYDPFGSEVFSSLPYEQTALASAFDSIPYPVDSANGNSFSVRYKKSGDSVYNKAYGSWKTIFNVFDANLYDNPFGGGAVAPDPFGRVIWAVNADKTRTKNVYNGLTTQAWLFHINGTATSGGIDTYTEITKDVLGRVLSSTPKTSAGVQFGARSEFSYDGLGNMTEVVLTSTEAGVPPQPRIYEYDALGHLLHAMNPETGTTDYISYDALGNLLEYRDQNSKEAARNYYIRNEYDKKGRPTVKARYSASTHVNQRQLNEWRYDESEGNTIYKNLPTSAVTRDEGGTNIIEEKFVYLAGSGRLGSKSVYFNMANEALPAYTYTIGYDYDGNGNLTGEAAAREGASSIADSRCRYNHGYLISKGFESVTGTGVQDIYYGIDGSPETLSFTNGTTTTYQKDAVNRLSGITTNKGSLGLWDSGLYQYDGVHNIKSIGDDIFSYDHLSRLMTATVHHDAANSPSLPLQELHAVALEYSYDGFGNLTDRTINNPEQLTWMGDAAVQTAFKKGVIFTTDIKTESVNGTEYPTNRLDNLHINESTNETPYEYDPNGNVIQDDTVVLTYDSRDYTATVTNGSGTHSYFYDSSGERVAAVTVSGGELAEAVYYLRSGSQVIAEEAMTFAPQNGDLTTAKSKEYLYVGANLATTRSIDMLGGGTGGSYTISGIITDGTDGLDGITVRLSGGNPFNTGETITTGGGLFTFAALPGGNYIITPESDTYVFTPYPASVTVGESNPSPFVTITTTFAECGDFSISGTVTCGSGGLAGVKLTAVGPTCVKSDIIELTNGNYSIGNLKGGVKYIVTPFMEGYTFSPSQREITIGSANVTGVTFQVVLPTSISISGMVHYFQGGLDGVTITAVNHLNQVKGTATTNLAGEYTLTGLPSPESKYTLTALKGGYTIEPASIDVLNTTINVEDMDFTATGGIYTISGTVLNGCNNLPLEGIPVGLSPGFRKATTDASGHFSFDGCGNGSFTIYFPVIEGWLPQELTRTVTVAGGDLVISPSFKLDPVLRGAVTRNGRELADVMIRLMEDTNNNELFDGADQEKDTLTIGTLQKRMSSFCFPTQVYALESGKRYFIVPVKEHYSFVPENIRVDFACQPVGDLNFQAFPSSPFVSGYFTHMTSINSFTAYRARLLDPNNYNDVLQEVPLSDDGWYEIVGLEANHEYIVAPWIYCQGGGNCLLPSTFDPASYPVDLGGENLAFESADFNIFGGGITPSYTASGKVSWDGDGIQGVSVKIYQVAVDGTLVDIGINPVTTSSTGNWSRGNLAAGNYAAKPVLYGYAFTPESVPFTIAHNNVLNINTSATMLPAYSIQGYVYDDITGEPVQGVSVSVGIRSAVSDSSGYYSLSDLVSGPYTLVATKPGYDFEPASNLVEIYYEDMPYYDIPAHLITYHIAGHITTSGDAGYSSEEVLISVTDPTGSRNGTTYTDENGDYTIELLPCVVNPPQQTCLLTVKVSKPGYYFADSTETVTLTNADINNINFTGVYQPGWISGYVCRVETNHRGECTNTCEEYMRGVMVTGSRSDGSDEVSTYTDSDGFFRIGPFARGTTIELDPWLYGYESCETRSVYLNVAEKDIENDPLGVSFTDGVTTYRIEGYTRMAFTQACVGGVTVTLTDSNSNVIETTSFDDEINCGWYQFTGLPAGTYTLTASKPCLGLTPWSIGVTITNADVTDNNFTARTQTYSIYGTVTEMGGSPVAGAALSLYRLNNHIASTVSNSSGQYSFNGLANGGYTITIDSGCVPVFGMMSAYIGCASVEKNFVCEGGLCESKRQEAASRRDLLKRQHAIDNGSPQADNGDMDATADKDNPSALSLQASARIEASVAEYLFYHSDHLGTVRLITDNSGTVVSRHDYEPFGVEIAPYPTGDEDTAKNTHRFTGHERDANTGYDYMHYRSYGSNIGRFMKPDNITGNPLNPQSWNLYSYVRGNPVNFNDPTGHMTAQAEQQISNTGGGNDSSKVPTSDAHITAPTNENRTLKLKLVMTDIVKEKLSDPQVAPQIGKLQKEFGAIYKDAGIAVQWAGDGEKAQHTVKIWESKDEQARTTGIEEYVLNNPNAMGWAQPDLGIANVYLSESLALSKTSLNSCDLGRVLGRESAHEEGHNLLGNKVPHDDSCPNLMNGVHLPDGWKRPGLPFEFRFTNEHKKKIQKAVSGL